MYIHLESKQIFYSLKYVLKDNFKRTSDANNGYGESLDINDPNIESIINDRGYYQYNNVVYEAWQQQSGSYTISNNIVTPLVEDILLTTIKEQRKSSIKNSFIDAQANGRLTTSLGWDIDVRRSADQNDVQNMQSLYTYMEKVGLTSTTIVGADGIGHEVSLAELDVIITEMIGYGLGLYQHKWLKEMEILSATTAEQAYNVTW